VKPERRRKKKEEEERREGVIIYYDTMYDHNDNALCGTNRFIPVH